jgi:rhodanese-related sulfurtransferase
MNTKKRSLINKSLIGSIVVLSVFLFTGCYEGYVPFNASFEDKNILRSFLTADSLNDYINDPAPEVELRIIDVRVIGYNLGHIPTAESYPSSEIADRLDELGKDEYLVVYCETGVRAQAVIRVLEGQGYTRMLNWGAGLRWVNAGYEFVQ